MVKMVTSMLCIVDLLAKSCLTLFDPMDCSPPGSCVCGFSRQECRSGLPCPRLGDLADPGIEPAPLMSPALAGMLFTTEPPEKPHIMHSLLQLKKTTTLQNHAAA